LIDLLRIGVVKSINADDVTARVEFDDLQGLVSAELPILQPGGCGAFQTYLMPNIGDQVLCCFLESGEEQGFVIGAVYSDEDRPAAAGSNLRYMRFGDGGKIEYSSASHTLTIDASGGVTINGGLHVEGDITVSGAITAGGIVTAAGFQEGGA
jgi:phage baseplate assembly protein V